MFIKYLHSEFYQSVVTKHFDVSVMRCHSRFGNDKSESGLFAFQESLN